jgi:aminodeoxychorismate synthase component I
MRVPRRHRFRSPLDADALFARLPGPHRFRMGRSAGDAQVFGAAPVSVVGDDAGRGVPKDALRRALPRVPSSGAGRFPGGAVGCIAYERGYDVEGLERPPAAAPGPDVWFGVYDTFAATLPETSEVEVVSWGLTEDGTFDEKTALARAEDLEDALRVEAAPARRPLRPPSAELLVHASLDAEAHARALAAILEAIRRGDIYQANLTARFEVATPADPVALFERLLRDNPSPHALFLETHRGAVISSSPERLLLARERSVETRPIKGTAPRDVDPRRDRALAAELLASPKNRAELLMITDLLRNDLGKVCEPGTVRVPRLVALESFPHLHHLVSTVTGRLRPPHDVLDALEAVFPCGSVTGAPKRRAMEILRELEPVARGVYTGTAGWIGFDRTADFAVAIRTGVLENGVFSFGSGGGIVVDSEAGAEWSELTLKARAFALALGVDLEAEVRGRRS